eukprot:tig00000507_g1754.t1
MATSATPTRSTRQARLRDRRHRRIKAKYDGLQGLMMYAPPMVTINPCINTEQGKAWSDEKKAFTKPSADEFLKLLEALDAKFCEFVQQNQAKLKVSPGRSLSKAFYKYLNMRIRTQTMAGKRKTVPVVDMSNYLITSAPPSAPET